MNFIFERRKIINEIYKNIFSKGKKWLYQVKDKEN